MDYEKLYKEAFERAKTIYKCSSLYNVEDALVSIFFELKEESEDEKIRKWLINLLSTMQYHHCDDEMEMGNKALTWLEKQGEGKSINDTDEDIVEAVKDTSVLDKVEPKFKPGDWIVNNDSGVSQHIKEIVNVNDEILYVFDEDKVLDVNFQEQYHLWTIADAKDGDVLMSVHNQPFIYNGESTELAIGAYGGLDVYGGFIIGNKGCYWTNNKNIKPATKEQRDLLFQKIGETIYEWDAESKKLKKISQRMISAEAKEALYDKPACAWSDEDDVAINRIVACLENLNVADNDILLKDVDWLKSLKQRIRR